MIDRSFEDIRTYFDAVVFDLDGTLVDTAPGILAYLNEMLFEFGRPGLDLAAMRPMIGDGVRSLMTKGLEASGGVPEGLDLEALFHRYLQRYVTNPARSSLPYPGVISVLETLAESGMALGVCTNKPQEPTDRLLKSLDLEKFFGAVIGGDALPVKKPDPVHLLTVLERLEITPNRAVLIGDSETDARAARAANIPCILVSFGYTAIPARDLGADGVIDDFSEFFGTLSGLSG